MPKIEYVPNFAVEVNTFDLTALGLGEISIQHPKDIYHITIDLEGGVYGFQYEPVKSGDYYHPQPGTVWYYLGSILVDDQTPELTQTHLITL